MRSVLSAYLKEKRGAGGSAATAAAALRTLYRARVLPDVESASLWIARSLLPIVRKLKWSIRKDKLARMVREDAGVSSGGAGVGMSAKELIVSKIEGKGRGLWKESERYRLAICPGIRHLVQYYEALAK